MFSKATCYDLVGPIVSLGDKIMVKKNNSIRVNYLILCSVCFSVKYFLENIFCIFRCLVESENNGQRKSFSI